MIIDEEILVEKGKERVLSGEVLITRSTVVPEGALLLIEPGTKLIFKHYRLGNSDNPPERIMLQVYGTLEARGTADEPIWFTSDADKPCNGDWRTIKLYNSDESIIKYCIVEYNYMGINLWRSSPLISHSVVRWSICEGIYLEDHCSPLIEYNTIYENGYNGIAMEQFNSATIRYNTITRCGTCGIHCDRSHAKELHNLVVENGFTGLSADNHSSVKALYNTVLRNGNSDVHLGEGEPSLTLEFNTIGKISGFEFSSLILNHNNILEGIDVRGSKVDVDARYNWWGTDSRSSIKKKIRDQKADPSRTLGVVHYQPYLISKVERNSEGIEEITSEISYSYKDLKPYGELGYIPGDLKKDRFPYLCPEEDETRKVLKKMGKEFHDKGLHFPWSVAWDGKYIWAASVQGKVGCLHPDTGKVLKSFPAPGPQSWGMTWDGRHLWINDFAEHRIDEVDPEDGKLLSSFSYPFQGASKGITWDGEYLYIMEWRMGGMKPTIYQVDKSGSLTDKIEGESPPGEFVGGGMTWDGECFWICLGNVPGGKIYRMDKSGKIICWINPCSSGTWDLAWGGDNILWTGERTQENWKDDKIFKVKILKSQKY